MKQPWLFASAAVACLLSAAPTAVQGQSRSTSSSVAVTNNVIDEVIVSARRRDERLQDVPIAISAFSGDDLRRLAITRTDDLRTKVPGLTIQNASYGNVTPLFSVRGQVQRNPVGAFDQSVSIYIDEVAHARAAGIVSSLYDLESVQVLKGPQGTLFGRNSTGGAVLFTTARPKDQFEALMRLGAGSHSQALVEGMVNLPVSESLQVRLAGQFSKHRGYTRNLATGTRLDDERSLGLRGSIRFRPTDKLENNLLVNYSHQDPHGTASRLFYTAPNALGATVAPILAAVNAAGFWTSHGDDPRTDVKVLSVIDRFSYQITPDITFKTIIGFVKTKAEFFVDYDGTPLVLSANTAGTDYKQYTVEPQLSGVIGNLTWTAGLFYFQEKGVDHTDTIAGTTTRVNEADINNKAYAAYAQGTYKLTDTVSLTAGIRQTKDKRSSVSHNFIRTPTSQVCRLTVANSGTAVLDPCDRGISGSHSEPTYTFAVDWKPLPDLLLYATTRKGYRAGPIQYSGTRPADFRVALPETLTDYEVGFKSTWRSGESLVRLNVAAFSSDYKNIQKSVARFVVDAGVTFLSTATINAAAGSMKGFEADATWEPNRYVAISGFVGHLEAKYKRFINPADGVSRVKDGFPNAPKWTWGGSIDLHTGETERGEFSVRADIYHQGRNFVADFNTNPVTGVPNPFDMVRANTLVNFRADWRDVQRKGFDMAIWMRNAFNEKYYAGSLNIIGSAGTVIRSVGAPRTWGVEVSKRF